MPDGAVMQNGGAQRRFRKRGGAKKKKKPRADDGSFYAAAGENGESDQNDQRKSQARESNQTDFAVHKPGVYPPPYESQLDPELARYLYQLRDDLDRLQNDPAALQVDVDGGDSPALLLSRNGLSSLRANMHEVALEPMGSRVLETLIRGASGDPDTLGATLSAALDLGARRVSALVQHRCASHVLQSLIVAVSSAIFSGNSSDAVLAPMRELAAVLGAWTLEEVAEVMYSSCGSHVFRTIVASLSGLPAEEPKEQKLDDSNGSARLKTYIELTRVEVPQEWLQALASLGERLADGDTDGGLHNFLWTPSSSAAFQGLLSAVSCADRNVAKRLVKGAVKDASCLDVAFDSCGARFLERVVVCLGSGYVMGDLKGNLAQMADDGKANFVLQRVLLGLKGRGSVMSVWDELEPSLPKMIGIGSAREGVVLAMIRAAECEGDEQTRRRAARSIAKAAGASGANAKHLVGILITGDLERWESWRRNVKKWADAGMGVPPAKNSVGDETSVLYYGGAPGLSLLGILMARSILRFPGGPGQASRDSMANMSAVEILALCSHAVGSRLVEQWTDVDNEHGAGKASSFVVNAILESGTIGAVSRSPYGAQILCRTIPRSSGPLRRLAMESLATRASHLREHDNGRQVIRKCRVDDYIRRGDVWETAETARDTRHRLFEDILEANEEPTGRQENAGGGDTRESDENHGNIQLRHAKEGRNQGKPFAGGASEPVPPFYQDRTGNPDADGDTEAVDGGFVGDGGSLKMNGAESVATDGGDEAARKARRERKKETRKKKRVAAAEAEGPALDNVLSAISKAAEPARKKKRKLGGKK